MKMTGGKDMKDTKEIGLKQDNIIAKREAFKRVFRKYYALRPDDVIVDAFIREIEEAG